MAEDKQLHELLISTYEIGAKVAEKENNYRSALVFTKLKEQEAEKLKARNGSFNMESYFLKAEKEQLATEKLNKELEVRLKQSQIKNLTFLIVLLLCSGLGLTYAYNLQRKEKVNIARQSKIIQEQSKQLKDLDLAKSRFFANVSHELRTPLTLIKGPISHLRNNPDISPKNQYLLNQVLVNVKHLEDLVNKVLDLRKLEMGKMELGVELTGLFSFFDLHIAQFESLAHQKEIVYTSNIKINQGQLANLDREKCRQVLYNLLSNAFKFTPVGGTVAVNIELIDSSLSLSVRDTGPGIHRDDLQNIFTRFFQAKKSDTVTVGGTGIGLSLCYEYAKLFGGTISAESQLGEGSIFNFSFPIELIDTIPEVSIANFTVKDQSQVTSFSREITSDDSISQNTVLVVEDNEGLQNYLEIILSEKYRIITANNGKKALEILEKRKDIDLVLSDVMMPVMDGYELLQQLKSSDKTRHIPVVMLTARAEKDDKLKALRIGVDDYMTKPFEEEELIARVENLLTNLSLREDSELNFKSNLQLTNSLFSEEEYDWLMRFESYIKQNISSESINVKVLTEEFAMSESTLLRQLKRMTGMTTTQYISEVRLNEAYRLIETKAYSSISKVAAMVGYYNYRSLNRRFKERFGKLPSDMIEETL